MHSNTNKRQSPKGNEQAALDAYIDTLCTAFIVQYKVNQIRDILAYQQSALLVPRTMINAIKYSYSGLTKKRVSIEF